jgi:hypothetical protein
LNRAVLELRNEQLLGDDVPTSRRLLETARDPALLLTAEHRVSAGQRFGA